MYSSRAASELMVLRVTLGQLEHPYGSKTARARMIPSVSQSPFRSYGEDYAVSHSRRLSVPARLL